MLDFRDRAILKFFLYSGARLSTVCRLKIPDFHQDGDQGTIRLHEKGDKRRTIGLHFTAAQAYRGAHLIAESDAIACAVLTARHVGRLSAKRAARILWQLARTVRRTFNAVCGYRRSGIVRRELIHASPPDAHEVPRMGVLPQAIWDQSVMPENSPPRRPPMRSRAEVAKPHPSREFEIRSATDSSPSHAASTPFEDDLSDVFPT